MTPSLHSWTTTFWNFGNTLTRFGGDSITNCRYPLTESRKIENIEIDMQGHRRGTTKTTFRPDFGVFTPLMEMLMDIGRILTAFT